MSRGPNAVLKCQNLRSARFFQPKITAFVPSIAVFLDSLTDGREDPMETWTAVHLPVLDMSKFALMRKCV